MGLPFLSSQAKKPDAVVAIDLGGRTTKAVHLQRRADKLGLVSYALADAPASARRAEAACTAPPDTAPSPALLAEHLRGLCRLLDCGRACPVTLVLGVTETLFRQVEVPRMPVSDVRLMLKYNAKTYLQQDLPDHVFDCCYVPAKAAKPGEPAKPAASTKQRVLVGAARRQTVEQLQAAVREAGMVPHQVVPAAVGPLNAFELAEPELCAKEVVALVDLGFKNTTIFIVDAGELALHRVVNLGDERLTFGLAESLGISTAEAEQIKLGMADEVATTLEPLVHPLGRELRASIDFFENQHDKTVSQAFLFGGPARSELLVQTLQAELMVPCKSWSPVPALQPALGPQQMGEIEQVAPQLTVALGAALSAF